MCERKRLDGQRLQLYIIVVQLTWGDFDDYPDDLFAARGRILLRCWIE